MKLRRYQLFSYDEEERPTIVSAHYTRRGARMSLIESMGAFPGAEFTICVTRQQHETMWELFRQSSKCPECDASGDRPHMFGCTYNTTPTDDTDDNTPAESTFEYDIYVDWDDIEHDDQHDEWTIYANTDDAFDTADLTPGFYNTVGDAEFTATATVVSVEGGIVEMTISDMSDGLRLYLTDIIEERETA